MNPTNNVIFVQKIIGYSLPTIIHKQPKHIEKCFEVNNIWEDTIINYMEYIWGHKGNGDLTFGHWALSYRGKEITSEKFWKKIAQKPESFFEKYWNQKSSLYKTLGELIWHSATRSIESSQFWEIIAQKNDSIFEFWNQKNSLGYTVWECGDGATGILGPYKIKSNKFWEIILQKPKSFIDKHKSQNEKLPLILLRKKEDTLLEKN
jgi:hypothetical protein